MNYIKTYNSIINIANSKKRVKGKTYFELHHIIPKSIGGNNNKNNLVLLTAKEHFICHHLLIKIHPSSKPLHDAFWLMCNNFSSKNQTRYKPNSITYESAKLKKSKNARQKWLKDNPNNHRDSSGINNPMFGIHRYGKDNPFYGKKHTKKSKNLISQTKKGIKLKPEHKEKLKKSWENRPIITCPHCGKTSIHAGNMNRYHFDNCKSLK